MTAAPLHRIRTLEEKLAAKDAALIVIDMQNDFCHPDGHFPKGGPAGFTDLSQLKDAETPLLQLIEAARKADVLRIFVRSVFDPQYLSPPFAEKRLQLGSYGKACLADTWGGDYVSALNVQPGPREIEVKKHRYSAFRDTDLNAILRASEIKTVVITGVTTSVCVDSTVRDAFFNDYFVVVSADATADYTDEKHRVYLGQIGALFGDVKTSAEIAAHWR